jgi:serine/threonine protein kinase
MGTFDQRYQSVRRLGEGGFGVVWLVKRKADGRVRLASRSSQSSLSARDHFHSRVSGSAQSLTYILSSFLICCPVSAWRPQTFALKTFKAAMDDQVMLSKLIDTEIELLKHLSHPNIVSFHELLDDGDGQQRVIMEYCSGGDLSVLLNRARTSG